MTNSAAKYKQLSRLWPSIDRALFREPFNKFDDEFALIPINVFVAINYDFHDPEIIAILDVFEMFEAQHPIRFHMAGKEHWLGANDNMFQNVLFLARVCNYGFVFYTKSQTVRDSVHNPNVAKEHGVLRANGLEHKVFLQKDVPPFSNIKGCNYVEYSGPSDIIDGIKRSLHLQDKRSNVRRVS